jgi:hypothetical protein
MNPYFIAGSVVAIVMAYGVGHWQGDDAGQAKVQAKWDQEKAKLAEEYASNVAKMREKEQAMTEASAVIMEKKNHELREINARATALSNSLRQRPERTESSNVSSAATSCSGASGKELARGDAEFLAGYSTDAARLQAALNQCLAQYEAIRR